MYTFEELKGITAKLRSEEGCPWDRAQTFGSLKKHLASEAEEVFQAVDNGDMENLCEELGDVLFQVMINSQIASEHGCFTIEDVRDRSLESDKNAGKSQKTLTNQSKKAIND